MEDELNDYKRTLADLACAWLASYRYYAGFPNFGVPFLGVPIIRTTVYWGLFRFPILWETTMSHGFRVFWLWGCELYSKLLNGGKIGACIGVIKGDSRSI